MGEDNGSDIYDHYYDKQERTLLTIYLGVIVIPVAVVMNSLLIISVVKSSTLNIGYLVCARAYVPSNIMLMYVSTEQCGYKKLRIVGCYFVLNLAAANLLATTISAPIIISNILKEKPRTMMEAGPAFLCDLTGVTDATLFSVGLFSIMLSSIDRACAVCKPFTYHKIINLARVKVLIAASWIVSIVISLPPTRVFNWGAYAYSRFSYSCGVSNDRKKLSEAETYYFFFWFMIVILIPLVIVCVSYALILYTAILSINYLKTTESSEYRMVERGDSKRRKQTLKSSLRTLALVGVFVVTTLPMLVIAMVMWLQQKIHKDQPDASGLSVSMNVAKILHWVTYAAYALNPLVFGLMDRNFRGAYKSLVSMKKNHDEFRRRAQKEVYEEFRKRAQKEVYKDMMDDRRRSIRLKSIDLPQATENGVKSHLTRLSVIMDVH